METTVNVGYRLIRHYQGGEEIMCEASSYETAQKALYYYAHSDLPSVYFTIERIYKVVDE